MPPKAPRRSILRARLVLEIHSDNTILARTAEPKPAQA